MFIVLVIPAIIAIIVAVSSTNIHVTRTDLDDYLDKYA